MPNNDFLCASRVHTLENCIPLDPLRLGDKVRSPALAIHLPLSPSMFASEYKSGDVNVFCAAGPSHTDSAVVGSEFTQIAKVQEMLA